MVLSGQVGPACRAGPLCVGPVEKLAPRDAVAATDLATWNVYGPETPGSHEVCYFIEPAGDANGNTQAVLHNAAATQGMSLKFNIRQLPCFSLWKNREAACDGYVTGLEPATNFPNIKSFEKAQGRVVGLEPGESRTHELELEPLMDAAGVHAASAAVAELQQGASAEILSKPEPRWSAGG